MIRYISIFFGTVFLAFIIMIPESAMARTITIAVVKDGPSLENKIIEAIKPEVSRMVGKNITITFKESPGFDAQWQKERYSQVIKNALDDNSVDIILGIGILITQEAAKGSFPLTKPFVSATPSNGNVPKLPYSKDNHSLKKNLCVIITPQRTDNNIKVLRSMVQFNRLHIGIDEEQYRNLPDLQSALRTYTESNGIEIVAVPMTSNARDIIHKLEDDKDMQAFYLITLPRLITDQRWMLVDYLNKRKIPTISNLGPKDLQIGVLVTNQPDISKQVVRRISLNLLGLINGSSTRDLPALLDIDAKLQINAKTAKQIGYSPDFETRASATFLYEEELESDAMSINLHQVFQKAEQGNAALAVSSAQVETAMRNKQEARGNFFPTVVATGSYQDLNYKALEGLLPDNQASAGLSVRQMIFDDQLISRFRSAGRNFEATDFQHQADRLDTLSQAGQTYLKLIQAILYYKVQLNNLNLTKENLDIAKMRMQSGVSGKDEVYRWQASLAHQKGLLLSTESAVEAMQVDFNQTMGTDQSVRWQPEEITVEPGEFYLFNGQLDFVFSSSVDSEKFLKIMVDIALENSPEINYISKALEAQEITVGYRKRSFLVPKVGAEFSYNHRFYQSPSEPEYEKDNSIFEVTASLPIFEGTKKIYNLKKEYSLIKQFSYKLDLARELVEKRTRTAFKNIESSLPNIKFSQDAFQNARKNFDVAKDKYASGIINITDLIDAQSSSYQLEQNAVSSIYKFLSDLIEFQRAIAFFEDDKSSEDIEALVRRVKSELTEM